MSRTQEKPSSSSSSSPIEHSDSLTIRRRQMDSCSNFAGLRKKRVRKTYRPFRHYIWPGRDIQAHTHTHTELSRLVASLRAPPWRASHSKSSMQHALKIKNWGHEVIVFAKHLIMSCWALVWGHYCRPTNFLWLHNGECTLRQMSIFSSFMLHLWIKTADRNRWLTRSPNKHSWFFFQLKRISN